MNDIKVGNKLKINVGGRTTYYVVTEISGDSLKAKQCAAPDPVADAFDALADALREARRQGGHQ